MLRCVNQSQTNAVFVNSSFRRQQSKLEAKNAKCKKYERFNFQITAVFTTAAVAFDFSYSSHAKDPLPKCRTFRAAERKRNATLRKKTKKRKLRKDKQKSEKYPLNSTCVALLTHSSDAVWQSVLRFPWNTHHIFIVCVSVLHNIACRKIPNKSLTLPLSPSFSRSTYAE